MTSNYISYLNKSKRAIHYAAQYLPKYKRVCDYYYNSVEHHDIDEYSTSINPYDIYWVNPDKIKKSTRRELPAWREKHDLFGNVRDGDWDIRCKAPINNEYSDREWYYRLIHSERFEDSILHQSFIDRYRRGTKWEDTKIYKYLIDGINRGQKCHYGIESKVDLKNWCRYMDQLYERIDEEGYLTQFQLGNRRTYKKLLSDEIMVDISRDGNLLFVDNRHRLSISKILNLKKVPIVVGVRHQLWMEKAKDINRGSDAIL